MDLCIVLETGLTILAQVVLAIASALLDGWAWWDGLPPQAKRWGFAGLSLVVACGSMGGMILLECPNRPTWQYVVYAALATAWSFLQNGYRHEVASANGQRPSRHCHC